jgi:hypothetical protein
MLCTSLNHINYEADRAINVPYDTGSCVVKVKHLNELRAPLNPQFLSLGEGVSQVQWNVSQDLLSRMQTVPHNLHFFQDEFWQGSLLLSCSWLHGISLGLSDLLAPDRCPQD